MREDGLLTAGRRRPTAKSACLAFAVLCGVMTVCLAAAIWNWSTWEAPSNPTRMRVETEMKGCALDASELPTGWRKGGTKAFPPRFEYLPVGSLGSILTGFSHARTSAANPASHEMKLYVKPYQAAFYYKLRRIGYISRWHRTWQPYDLRQAGLSADEYRSKCSEFVPDVGPGRGDKLCETKARYGRTVSVFRTDVSPRGMSEEEMIGVLQAIDRHMLRCSELFADKEWEEE